MKLLLFGSRKGETFGIPAGVHNYRFSFRFPNPVPYSVEGEHGKIEYKLIAELDIRLARDLRATRPISVLNYEDLNLYPELSSPRDIEEIKTFCCFPCRSKPLIMNLKIPRIGFALGETINVEVLIRNLSSKTVYGTTLALRRIESFTSSSPYTKTMRIEKVVTRSTSRGIRAGEESFFVISVEVPRTALLSNDRYCHVYQITYELHFVAKMRGFNFSPKCQIPITVGTIGIRNS